MSMLHASPKTILALLMMLMCAACNPSSEQVVLKPNLPEPPESLGRPFPVPHLKKGVRLRIFMAAQHKRILQANKRLKDDREWVEDLIRNYSNTQQPEAK